MFPSYVQKALPFIEHAKLFNKNNETYHVDATLGGFGVDQPAYIQNTFIVGFKINNVWHLMGSETANHVWICEELPSLDELKTSYPNFSLTTFKEKEVKVHIQEVTDKDYLFYLFEPTFNPALFMEEQKKNYAIALKKWRYDYLKSNPVRYLIGRIFTQMDIHDTSDEKLRECALLYYYQGFEVNFEEYIYFTKTSITPTI